MSNLSIIHTMNKLHLKYLSNFLLVFSSILLCSANNEISSQKVHGLTYWMRSVPYDFDLNEFGFPNKSNPIEYFVVDGILHLDEESLKHYDVKVIFNKDLIDARYLRAQGNIEDQEFKILKLSIQKVVFHNAVNIISKSSVFYEPEDDESIKAVARDLYILIGIDHPLIQWYKHKRVKDEHYFGRFVLRENNSLGHGLPTYTLSHELKLTTY